MRHRISRHHLAFTLFFTSFAALLAVAPARAHETKLPPEAVQAMDKMYSGDPDGAIAILHNLEQSLSCSKAKRAGGRSTAPTWKSNTA
jgi:hypothetical protein